MITQNRGTHDHWESVVDDMASRGAEGTDEELDQVVQYLAAHFGPDSAPGGKAKSVPQTVDVNAATAEGLVRTLGLTQAGADAVLAYRAKHGSIGNLQTLEKIPGVDAKQIEQKKTIIRFGKE
jgi:competence ComEA-like helix-hairpin-helix protein